MDVPQARSSGLTLAICKGSEHPLLCRSPPSGLCKGDLLLGNSVSLCLET